MNVISVKRIHQSDWSTEGVRFLRARDIVADYKHEEVEDLLYISQEKYEECSALVGKVAIDDMLVTGVGTIGIPYLIKDLTPLYFKDGNIIWFQNNGKIQGDFFYYSFTAAQIQNFIKDSAGIGTVGTYTIESGKKTPILLPSEAEQNKIGQFFKDLDNLITLHQSKSFWYILKSIVSCTLYWEQRKLGEVTTSYSGGTPNVSNCEYYGDEIPFIRSGEINNRHTDLFITEKGLLNSSAAMVKEGDILYALYGATSGEVSRSKLKGAINQAILAILPKTKYDSEYIAQWLKIKKRYIVDTYLQGGQGNLSGNIVKNFIVDFSSYNEQLNIGNLASSLDHLITLHQLEPYNLIFKAIAYRIIDYAKSKPPKCIK